MELYVTTNADGEDRSLDELVSWDLPSRHDGHWHPGRTIESTTELVLRDEDALLDVLDESVFVAEVIDGIPSKDHEVRGHRARLLAGTSWDVTRAATFAIDCVAHALGDSGEVPLPDGHTLAQVLDDAREFLTQASSSSEERLSVLARLGAARRLKKEADRVGDLAFEVARDDLAREIDITNDPAWTTLAAIGDAVMAAVETLRHLALPRYYAVREATSSPQSQPSDNARITTTPWGPIVLGAQYQSPYVTAAVAAREAAFRAREEIARRLGETQAATERQWQARRLAELIS